MLECAEPGASVVHGHGRTEDAERAEARPQPPREGVVAVDRRGVGCDLAVRELADASAELLEGDRTGPRFDRHGPYLSRAAGTVRAAVWCARPPTSDAGRLRERSEGAPTGHARRPSLGRVPRQRRRHACTGRGATKPARPGARGRRGGRHRAAPLAREARRPRACGASDRPRLRIPRALTARSRGPLRRPGARGGHHHGHRSRARDTVRDRGERRHREGWHLPPHDGEEAPAGTGDRDGEPPALHLPGGFRRCVPAVAGGGLPRPRALRTDLLQPGADVGPRHPADRRGDGIVHRRWRVRPGDVGRDGDRAWDRNDLPGRPTPREGRHGRGRERRGARGRRRPRAPQRGGRSRGRGRRARAASRAGDRGQPEPPARARMADDGPRGSRRGRRGSLRRGALRPRQ